MRSIPLFLFHWTGFLIMTLVLFPGAAGAQEMLDSVDSLLSAQFAAYNRAQSGYLTDALEAEKSALETAQNRYGPTHPSVVPVLNDLASLYRILGQYDEAESTLKWGLAIRERKLGPEDPLVADSQDQLASLYNNWGRWKDAEFYGRKALALREKEGNSGALVQSLQLLGETLLNLHQTEEAEKLLSQGLSLQEKSGENPGQTISLLSSLALAYQSGKDLPDAETCFQKILALAQKNHKPDSIEVADAVKKLADFYASTGRKKKAGPLYDSVLKIDKGYVGVYFGFTVLPYMQRLAEAYQSVGDFGQAGDLLEKALATTKESFGPRHPLVAVTLIRLANAETGLGQEKAAKDARKEALGILKPLFPKDYPLIAQVESQLINK